MLATTWRVPAPPGGDADAESLQNGPGTAFSPVAVTPDELGEAWAGGRVHAALESRVNGGRSSPGDSAAGSAFHFGELIAQLAARRRVGAGSIVGGGHAGTGDATRLQPGDTLRIEVTGRDGLSLFGAIEQRVRQAGA
jgi:fumarylacetoacetate (FAA) hydrolase